MSGDLQETLESAEQALADGGDGYALELVEPHLAEATETLDDSQWRRLVSILREVFALADNPDLVAKFDAQLAAPKNPRAAYQLGYGLIEIQRPTLASAVLARGLRYASDDLALRNELAASLELQGRYREAAAALEHVASRSDAPFLTRYLRAFNLIASGQSATALRLVKALVNDGDAAHESMRARLGRILRRQELVGEDRSPRALQFVLTGALLLEDERVAYREESWASLGLDLLRLRAVLERIDRKPARIVSLRSARQDVFGLAASQLWALPLVQEYVPTGEGLYVSDTTASPYSGILPQLRQRRPGQIYYAHYAPATLEQPVCPDAICVRGDHVVTPWDLFKILDPRRTDLPTTAPTESPERWPT